MTSTSMNVDTATVPTGESDGPFRLTPFLNNTPQTLFSSPSPWMTMIDFESLGKGSSVTPANLTPEGRRLLEQQQLNTPRSQQNMKDALRMAERNKFEKSFAMALGTGESQSRSVGAKPKDAEVPDMNDGAGPALPTEAKNQYTRSTSDQNVPQSSNPSKRKDSSSKRNGGADSPDSESRKAKRREQNRRNAAKCRQRKIDRVNELSEQLEVLKKENSTLKQAHAALAKKLAALAK
eukprot:m.75542 g.75542  ORF g.75542 m.75542 type:complete len:236 (-) comp16174_c0_seq1:120-827(-)